MDDDDTEGIAREFRRVVNMPPAALRKWLRTEESRSVGMTPDGEKVTDPKQDEAVGHGMGRTILAIRAKKAAQLDADDYAAMRKVIGYVHRHSKQRPKGDVTDTRWRHALMNWGHDPLK
ncbi:DUF3140 domain-containing protein [Lichenicoccus sp.]|uniref:DUF3140 domain-containing protein n=1 Tax=Lichenicoccus sp. TaxID=2781899 RepID=UPI003D09BC7B